MVIIQPRSPQLSTQSAFSFNQINLRSYLNK